MILAVRQSNPLLLYLNARNWEMQEEIFIQEMEEGRSRSDAIIAPFVMKTYHMVNDPTTDSLIAWGTANNSFIVLQPLQFSDTVLPFYFKHSNFSSFVRQLNTYGFKKVDPDKWEFANEWFLRGQVQLLSNIVRRKYCSKTSSTASVVSRDCEVETEVAKLKHDQKLLEQELESMKRRLETTERRPQQMVSFLYTVAQDPQILTRLVVEKARIKRRLMPDESETMAAVSSPNADQSSKSLFGQDGQRYSAAWESANTLPPYPFSLLGGGF